MQILLSRPLLSHHAIPLLLLLAACGGATQQRSPSTALEMPVVGTQRPPIEMEEIHITATTTSGGIQTVAYDAETLFTEGNDLLHANRCVDAIAKYDRVISEFPQSGFVSPSLYNSGLCFERANDLPHAEERFERLIRLLPNSQDVKHAMLIRADLLIRMQRPEDGIAAARTVLERTDLSSDERMEGLSRVAQAELAAGRIARAREESRSALSWARTRPVEDAVRDTTFAAVTNFVLAETHRLDAEATRIPAAEADAQRVALEQRAQHVLDAQREYFNTIRFGEPHWSSASGYRIGQMYDAFWTEITTSPAPPRPDLSATNRRMFEEEYRNQLVTMVRPLLQHATRYWELTLLMAERNGVRNEWADRTREDLTRLQTRLGVASTPAPSPLLPEPPTDAANAAPATSGAGAEPARNN